MQKNYSLNLPEWGPYNKTYLGVAHIADKKKGLRFDLNLFPGYFRRSVMLVRDLADSGVKMMGASKKLTRFIYRYELEWKDRVYIEADFKSENNVMTVTCDFVNNTQKAESLSLNAVMSMKGCTQYHNPISPNEVNVIDGLWIDALDYSDIKISQKIASDGLYLGEARASGFVGGSFLSSRFFGKKGDSVSYKFDETMFQRMGVRYKGGGKIILKLGEKLYEIELPDTNEISVYTVDVQSGKYFTLDVYPLDCTVDFDGFVIGDVEFSNYDRYFTPMCENTDDGLKILFGDKEYVVKVDTESHVLRNLYAGDVGQLLVSSIHHHVSTKLGKEGSQYVDLFIRPVFVEPNSKKTVTITIIAPKGEDFGAEHTIFEPICNSLGEKYRISQKIMSAVTLTNVVWPIYSRRGYILHNTPGRNWDSLYTWDSGFTGMGLSELDIERAKDCLNAYLTPVGDIHSPYIFHGTPLPTQIFLYAEIFSKTSDIEFLKKFYPLIYQQYRFFADMRKSPDAKKTGMFQLWNIFYNSGGWDDYPAQKYVHDNHLEKEVCPVINTAMTVLFGKILKNHAEILSLDTKELDEDIAFYSNAIETYAWDDDSGYYGYVKDDGTVLKIGNINADMGMDGVTPYIAGISSNDRSERIIDNIKSGMVTPIGVSVVDTRAPYYSEEGYWNGSVWMPHQWILWKACLDNGEAEFAQSIAKTALDLWESETAYTYNCYEHFMITNGRGSGFHQFSGLSTPVLMWFSSYHKPYTVTSGFLTIIKSKTVIDDNLEFEIKSTAQNPVVIVCMPENEKYTIKTSGRITVKDGVYTIQFDTPVEEKIIVKKN